MREIAVETQDIKLYMADKFKGNLVWQQIDELLDPFEEMEYTRYGQ